jgi:hypothetical protein
MAPAQDSLASISFSHSSPPGTLRPRSHRSHSDHNVMFRPHAAAERRGAWRWRSSHHDVAGGLETVDDALSHDRGQQLGGLHSCWEAVTRQRESERRDEVVATGRD